MTAPIYQDIERAHDLLHGFLSPGWPICGWMAEDHAGGLAQLVSGRASAGTAAAKRSLGAGLAGVPLPGAHALDQVQAQRCSEGMARAGCARTSRLWCA